MKSEHWSNPETGGRPRVLQFISNLDIGGAQEVVRTLADYLTAAGCAVVVATLRDGPLRPAIEAAGVPVVVLPDRRYGITALPASAAELSHLRRALQQLIADHGINVVQTHLLRSLDFLAASLKASAAVQVYWTFHNASFDLRADHLRQHRWLLGPKRRVHHWLYRLGAQYVDGLIAVAPDVKASILATMPGIPAERIAVIPNGVDSRRFRRAVDRGSVRRSLGVDENARLIVTVATLKEQKGHRYLIDAAAPVLRQSPDVHFLLVGDGELRPALTEQIQGAGLGGRVHLLGERHDVPELLAAADLFVLPSLWEGLAMALVEAMAAGLPVIATDVSGTRDVIVDGITGLLLSPADSGRLAEALVSLLADPDRAEAMGSAGRRRVEAHFSASKQAAEHLALFRSASPLPRLAPTTTGWMP